MSIRWITRDDLGWGTTSAPDADCDDGLVLHYDGNNQGLASDDHSSCVSYWNATRNYHINTNGWADIGYSFGACPHGYVFEGRGINKQQAAQPGGNADWHSVTTMSGPDEYIPEDQRLAVASLHDWLISHGVATAQSGHRDFTATSCPGDIVYDMMNQGRFSPGVNPPSEVSVPDYSYLVHTEDTVLTPEVWVSIGFDEERADTGNHHGVGAQTFCGDAQYTGTINVRMQGMSAGSDVFLRTVEDDSSGVTVITHPRGSRSASVSEDGLTYFTHPLSGRVPSGRRAKIQIMVSGSGNPVLTSATLHAQIWEL